MKIQLEVQHPAIKNNHEIKFLIPPPSLILLVVSAFAFRRRLRQR